ncbi:MAG: DUF5658 family protein [Desulfobacterota bacterium]|jgi:hypothetical protein|nr:DUF5658 family protein [Thermodesulfobacteriota bacterium]
MKRLLSNTLTFPSFLVPLSVIFLSILDAHFTLICIQRGGSELNPFMRAALEQGTQTFVNVKMLFTIIPAFVLYALSRVRIAAYGLYLVNIIYLGILLFHLFHLIRA